jgi:hypothetical protein
MSALTLATLKNIEKLLELGHLSHYPTKSKMTNTLLENSGQPVKSINKLKYKHMYTFTNRWSFLQQPY